MADSADDVNLHWLPVFGTATLRLFNGQEDTGVRVRYSYLDSLYRITDSKGVALIADLFGQRLDARGMAEDIYLDGMGN